MAQSEIMRRVPAWHALSDLFVDTELQGHDHHHIADVILQAGFSSDEAEAILRMEVAPVFHTNLRSVAGEWAGWSEGEVREMILERLENPAWWQKIGWLREFILNRHMALIEEDWRVVQKCLRKS